MPASELLIERNPELIAEWDYEKNIGINLDTLKANSRVSAWWICRVNPAHKWETKVRSRAIDGHGCHYCSGRKVLKEESFAAKHPNIMKQWDYENNKNLDPWALSEHSKKKANWICTNNSEHIWVSTVSNRVRYGSDCPICARFNKKHRVLGNKSLVSNFPKIAREWHPTKNLPHKASDFTYGSAQRVWWQCSKNKAHVWPATITSRTRPNGNKCPYCSGNTVTSQNSLASIYPVIAREWHPTKNEWLTPENIKKASGKKVWWRCSNNPDHEWEAIVKNRTILGSGCPICETETKYLRLLYNQYDLHGSGTDYHRVFRATIYNIKTLLQHTSWPNKRLEQPYLRMIYAYAITALETYLSDAFFDSVITSSDKINKLFLSDPDFKNKKYSIEDVVKWHQTNREKATEHLQSIVWHNLAKVSHLYRNVLKIQIPVDNIEIQQAILMRHDIIHRNGRTKSGKSISLKSSDIEKLLKIVSDFIAPIDQQLDELNGLEAKI